MSFARRSAAAPCSGPRSRVCAGTSPSRRTMPKSKKPVESAAELIPDHPTVSSVREAAKECQACDLYKRGTQTVFGEGASRADLMFVVEQHGDAEDIAGRPLDGPAG